MAGNSDQVMASLERYFQPTLAFAAVLALAVTQYAILIIYMVGGSPDFVFGGDFIAFWAAARETLAGGLQGLYTPDGLETAIAAHRPQVDDAGLTWQYPPHASLIFSPIGYLPYGLAYALWCGLGLAGFTAMLILSGLRGRFLIAALATIPVLTALNTGQNALFTATLLMVAVRYAKSKPIMAGLAAAVLTIKPQLGLLLPVVYLAGGHWRAFYAAAIISLILWCLSAVALGPAAWTAFFVAVGSVSGSVSEGVMPLFKMVNVYAAARLLSVPEAIALALAGSTLLISIGAVVWICRRSKDWQMRYAVIACATLLSAPYSMYYELVILVPA
ncbi:MAG: glycosyltransferase family 87 protein, partial [Pseudomonadota bacterium]